MRYKIAVDATASVYDDMSILDENGRIVATTSANGFMELAGELAELRYNNDCTVEELGLRTAAVAELTGQRDALRDACQTARDWMGNRPPEQEAAAWPHYRSKATVIDCLDSAIEQVKP